MKEETRRGEAARLYTEGSRSLIEAIVRRAAKDYLHAARMKSKRKGSARMREIAAFFRSDYFFRLTGVRGEMILEKLEEEAKGK